MTCEGPVLNVSHQKQRPLSFLPPSLPPSLPPRFTEEEFSDGDFDDDDDSLYAGKKGAPPAVRACGRSGWVWWMGGCGGWVGVVGWWGGGVGGVVDGWVWWVGGVLGVGWWGGGRSQWFAGWMVVCGLCVCVCVCVCVAAHRAQSWPMRWSMESDAVGCESVFGGVVA
jgi:hypothetical protein